MPQSFKCPSCAAPLEYKGTLTQKCDFCGCSIKMDDDSPDFADGPSFGSGSLLEQAQKLKEVKRLVGSGNKIEAIKRFRAIFGCGLKEAKDAVENMEAGRPVVFTDYQNEIDGDDVVRVAKTVGFSFLGIVLAILLFTGIIVAVVIYSVSSTINRSLSTLKPSVNAASNPPIRPTPTTTPEKPQFAKETFRVGGEGMGAGQFKDNRSVAIDSDGNIYSAEYTGGKIQVFDAEGKFKKLLMVDEEKALLDMVTDRNGHLLVLMVGVIYRFDTKTGQELSKIEKVYFEDLAVGLDGLIYATVGMGGGADIVVLTPDGKEVKRFKNVIEQTSLKRASLENITLDGEGNIYVVDRMGYYILKFSKDGKYVNRFGGKNESGRKDVKGSLDSMVTDIAIDGRGNLFVSMVSNILVFDTNGAYVGSFDTRQAFGMAVTDKNELWVACRPFVVRYEMK
jgi:hypothetical protein